MRLVFKVLIFFFVIYTGFMVYIVLKSMENTVSSEGGENTCVNSELKEAWEADLERNCKDTNCIQMYNCVPSECICLNNTCILKKI